MIRSLASVDLIGLDSHSPDMNFDISHLLDQWEYQAGHVMVRRFAGRDGTEKLQLRVDLGLLQMNAQGRPDGRKPFGHASILEFLEHKANQYIAAHGGNEGGFTLTPEDCSRLQVEVLQFHHRCICFLHLGDYRPAVRDATRNIRTFDFVARFAPSEELAWSLEQFRPQALLNEARARAGEFVARTDFNGAIASIETSIEKLREFYVRHARHDLLEQSLELQALQRFLEETHQKRPLTRREQLELALADAVKREDYEKAAQVRDALRKLSQ
jgi:hypothetical protein